MKVKCIKLLDSDGNEVESKARLKLGEIYHVFYIGHLRGNTYFCIDNEDCRRDNWWSIVCGFQKECFEVISDVIPSTWSKWSDSESGNWGMSPAMFQDEDFFERFVDHDPDTFPVFWKEWEVILREDP